MLILRQRNDDCIWCCSVNYHSCDLSLPLSSVVYIAIVRQTYQQLKAKIITLYILQTAIYSNPQNTIINHTHLSTRKPQASNLNLKKQLRVVQQSHKYQRSSGTINLRSVTQTPSIDNTGVNPEISRSKLHCIKIVIKNVIILFGPISVKFVHPCAKAVLYQLESCRPTGIYNADMY